MKAAAIDLGSNTIKYTLAEVSEGALRVIAEDARITRIGQDLDKNGYLLDDAMDRTFEALSDMVGAARARGADKIACVATAGMRGASNAPDFLRKAKVTLDVDIEIIDGGREAQLAFQAPAAAFGPGPLIVFDVGGRSTELIFGTGDGIISQISFEMGAVRLTERFLPSDPPTEQELDDLWSHVKGVLEDAPEAPEGTSLVGVSGTIISLMGAHLGLDDLAVAVQRSEAQQLSRKAIEGLYDSLRAVPAKERIRGTVIPEGRADVIVAGTAITLATLDHYGLDAMTVSNRGVRYGLLFEMAAG